MEKGLLSVIIPCYNVEKTISRQLDSILMQDYDNVEIFIVNDGSTDDSESIILSYQNLFVQKGYAFTYLLKENGGLSSAINHAFKFVNGEFLIWPDGDDCYTDASFFSKYVSVFLNDPLVTVVRSLPTYVLDSEIRRPFLVKEYKFDLFLECMLGTDDFWYGAGLYMIRMSWYDQNTSERKIYSEKFNGQNIQLLLPTLYKGKCYTIVEYMYNIFILPNSHSRRKSVSYREAIRRVKVHEDSAIETLRSMNLSFGEYKFYNKNIQAYYFYKYAYIMLASLHFKDFFYRMSTFTILKYMTFRKAYLLCASLFYGLFKKKQ